jgi:hypothetical protein
MYTGASCRSDQGPPQWRNLISLNQAISHNGPYKFAGRYAHSALAGSEESQRLGNLVRGHAVVLPKDRPVAIEQFIKMNSVVGPFDALGNGTGLTDGALTTWVDGVKVDHRADLSWRRHPDWGVQGPWIVWYHGGVVPPGHVGHFRMYRMVVSKRYIGPIPKGNVRS